MIRRTPNGSSFHRAPAACFSFKVRAHCCVFLLLLLLCRREKEVTAERTLKLGWWRMIWVSKYWENLAICCCCVEAVAWQNFMHMVVRSIEISIPTLVLVLEWFSCVWLDTSLLVSLQSPVVSTLTTPLHSHLPPSHRRALRRRHVTPAALTSAGRETPFFCWRLVRSPIMVEEKQSTVWSYITPANENVALSYMRAIGLADTGCVFTWYWIDTKPCSIAHPFYFITLSDCTYKKSCSK